MAGKRASTSPPRIADRLGAARRAGFVGRQAELAQFRSALASGPPPFTALHVHGPGGVGKTTLLGEFARLAKDAGRPVLALDGRDIAASPDAFLSALGEALGPDGPSGATPAPDAVVLIDTYERLSSLDAWLRETLLPTWPARVVVVLAGREAPALAWTTDLAWAPLTRVVALRNLGPAEASAFLEGHGVAPESQARVLEFTHGHPLALALVADLLRRQMPAGDFDPREAPDLVRRLFGLFLDSVPDAARRAALDACALARVTRESLLVALFGPEEGRAAFDWLRSQSFVESGPRGVFPHDLVREVVLADARWRDAAALGKLSRRIYAALHAQIAAAFGRERQRLQMDALYVTRIRSSNASFFDWSALDEARTDLAREADAPWIFALVARHEGPASADLARAWWRAQPSAFQVHRGRDEAPFGFLCLLDVGGAGASAPSDPAIAAARAFVDRHGPVARGEGVVYLRWWMHQEAYQAVTAAINLSALHVVSHCVTRPGMAWNFVAMADPAFWAAHFDGVNFPRVPEADFEVGQRRYGVFAHDWRVEPPEDWMMGARTPMPFAAAGEGGAAAPLGPAEFERAVRQALRDLARPDVLGNGPLRSSRLLGELPDARARGLALQALLRAAADELRSNPRDLKLQRAVWHTYFEPLPTQEQAAERLGLPFSTYRHHLARGIERIARSLWHRERAL